MTARGSGRTTTVAKVAEDPAAAAAAAASSGGSINATSEDESKSNSRRELLNASVEAAWREGGALEGATQEAVVRTVRGTIQVARHYAVGGGCKS